MQKHISEGVTFEAFIDPATGLAAAGAVDTREGEAVFRRSKVDAKTFLRLVDDHLREYVAQVLFDLKAKDRCERELDRRVEVACKNAQGSIEKLLADEIERQVRARVQAYVATMPIRFRLCDGKEAKDGEALPE